MLEERISVHSPNTTLYTDGSYRNGRTSYAIVEQISPTIFEGIRQARLPDNSGIFIAEIAAIRCAIKFSVEQKKKTLICTDSLSATRALMKNNNRAYNDMLYHDNNSNIVILWIPSHIGIQGNECADNAARGALDLPEVTETPCFPKALSNPFKAILRQQNPTSRRPKYNENLSRSQCIMLARLRVGKAVFNTKHYYKRTDPPR